MNVQIVGTSRRPPKTRELTHFRRSEVRILPGPTKENPAKEAVAQISEDEVRRLAWGLTCA
jgi:hypothetical protein